MEALAFPLNLFDALNDFFKKNATFSAIVIFGAILFRAIFLDSEKLHQAAEMQKIFDNDI